MAKTKIRQAVLYAKIIKVFIDLTYMGIAGMGTINAILFFSILPVTYGRARKLLINLPSFIAD